MTRLAEAIAELWLEIRIYCAACLLGWTIEMLPAARRTYATHQHLLAAINAMIADVGTRDDG